MKIKQLEYLLKIAECGSISKAAEQLFISQPSLTKSVMGLEEEYGIQIFVRKARGVELTTDGKSFVHYARGVLTAVNALERNFAGEPGAPRSRLFVASQQFDFVYDLFLKVYLQNQDKLIHYNLVEADRSEVTRQVLTGEVDLGLLVRSKTDAKTFPWNTEARRLSIHTVDTAGIYACVGPYSPFYMRRRISFTEAQAVPHLVLDMESQAKQNLYFDNSNAHFNTKKIIFFNSISACEAFLLKTDALLFIAKWARNCFKDQRIRSMRVAEFNAPLDRETDNELLWIKRAGEPLNAAEHQFLEHLYQRFGKTEDLAQIL